jgi:hypothetical protein
MTRELLIKGGYVVTVDPELGDLPDGDVLVRDDIVAAVGPELTASAPCAEVIDARGRLVIPGLVDTRHEELGCRPLGTPIAQPSQHPERPRFPRARSKTASSAAEWLNRPQPIARTVYLFIPRSMRTEHPGAERQRAPSARPGRPARRNPRGR